MLLPFSIHFGLILFCWGVVLNGTQGHFYSFWPNLTLALAFLPFWGISHPVFSKKERFTQALCLGIAGSAALTLWGKIPAIKYIQNHEAWAMLRILQYGVLALSVVGMVRPRPTLLFAIATTLWCGLAQVPRISPAPHIDVWVYTQIASDLLLQGINPYTYTDFPRLYEDHIATFFYPPMTLFTLAPFQWLLGDIRWGLWVALGVTSLSFFLIARTLQKTLASSLGIAAFFLAFPGNLFLLEQSWTDPVSLMWASLSASAWVRNRRLLGFVLLGVFLSCKHYNLLFLPALLSIPLARWPLSKTTLKNHLADWGVTGISTLASIAPFLWIDFSGFIQRMTPGPPNLSWIFLSLGSWMGRHGWIIPAWIPPLTFVLIFSIGILVFLKQKSAHPARVLMLASTAFGFFLLLYTNSAMNYHWFSLAGFWLALCWTNDSALPANPHPKVVLLGLWLSTRAVALMFRAQNNQELLGLLGIALCEGICVGAILKKTRHPIWIKIMIVEILLGLGIWIA